MRRTTIAIAGIALIIAGWCLNAVLAAPGGDQDETKSWSPSHDGILATHPEISVIK